MSDEPNGPMDPVWIAQIRKGLARRNSSVARLLAERDHHAAELQRLGVDLKIVAELREQVIEERNAVQAKLAEAGVAVDLDADVRRHRDRMAGLESNVEEWTLRRCEAELAGVLGRAEHDGWHSLLAEVTSAMEITERAELAEAKISEAVALLVEWTGASFDNEVPDVVEVATAAARACERYLTRADRAEAEVQRLRARIEVDEQDVDEADITYTLVEEPGVSPSAAGFRRVAEVKPKAWTPRRAGQQLSLTPQRTDEVRARVRWERQLEQATGGPS